MLIFHPAFAGGVWDRLDLSHPGLEKVAAYCASNDYSGAASALLDYYRSRKEIVTPEIPDPANVDISVSEEKMVKDAMEHRFFVEKGYEVYFYGDDINWRYWPIHDNELRWQLHRHKWFTPMGQAFRVSGNEEYAREWARQYLDWIVKNPLIESGSSETEYAGNMSLSDVRENMRFAWRPLEVSHRVRDQIFQFQLFIDSEAFTPEFLVTFLENYYRHADYLLHHFSKKGNHLLFQAQRILYAGAFFTEFKDAELWRRTGIDILNREILAQVYPDGCQWELDPHYHLACTNIFCKALEMASLCGMRGEFPSAYTERLEKMMEFYANISYPDYQPPCFSDERLTEKSIIISDFECWSNLFPSNGYLRWMATEGKEGYEPPYLSVGYLDSGFFVFRTSRKMDAVQMVVKAGPPGEWHCQPDNGTFELWYKGRQLFPDSGSYVYGGGAEVMKWRNLFRSTAFHNTVTLDGKDLETTNSRTLLWKPEGRQQKLVTENPSYPGLTHRRTISFIGGKKIVIKDELIGEATGKIALHLHPGPDAMQYFHLRVKGPREMVARQEQGWVSYHIREKLPRPHLIWEVDKLTKKSVVFTTYIDLL